MVSTGSGEIVLSTVVMVADWEATSISSGTPVGESMTGCRLRFDIAASSTAPNSGKQTPHRLAPKLSSLEGEGQLL